MNLELIYFGGERVAQRIPSSGIVDYYEGDMLGSARTMVQAGQTTLCDDEDFLPFGDERDINSSCSQNYKFEGKERDLATGNDDFGARYYRSVLGRWLSPDWSSVPAPVPEANSAKYESGHRTGSTNMDEKRKSSSRRAARRSSSSSSVPRNVYLLWHTDSSGDEKLLGVYKKSADARSAISRMKKKPGFSDKGGAFEIARYELNKDHWADGFAQHGGSSLPAWFRPGR
jgi:RHS repeat-associated protein